MAKNKTEINIHARKYIAAVFENRLREEGFSCPNEKLLCWYRIRKGELLDTVIFCSNWSNLPLTMNIYYEVSLPFTRPLYILNVNYNSHFDDRDDCWERRLILEGDNINGANLRRYSDDIWVDVPGHGNRGLYTLTEVVLPYFDKIQTVEDCYLTHKQKTNQFGDDGYAPYALSSREFLDEVIYMGDSTAYPDGAKRAREMAEIYRELLIKKPTKENIENLQHWEQLEEVFSNGSREEYLKILQERKQKNIAYMKKHLKLSTEELFA